MKRHVVVAAVALVVWFAFVGVNLLTSGTARAQTMDDCMHAPTITSLEACVEHCAAQGFITDQGVTNSLLAKLDAAQMAQDRGQIATAINLLGAFIHELQAQAGKHIVQMHAQCMVRHAQLVIQALQNE